MADHTDAPDPTHLSEPVTPHQKKILFRRASSVVTPGSGADFATLDEIEEKGLKEAAISARKQVTWLKRPDLVIYHFLCELLLFIKWSSIYIATHRVTLFVLIPLTIAWHVAAGVDGEHHEYMDELRLTAEFVVWWMGLGILSSVGLGTGMHSGLLFLFPHIFKIVTAAEECGTTDFDARNDMWFEPDPFTCPGHGPDGTATFRHIFLTVFPAGFLWGTGTAMGEIPPYALSRAARMAGHVDEEFEEVMSSKSSWNVLNAMKDWMISFLQTHGFWGVLLMSAWPNMAFDLCGICCGHFLMPFWTFFGATLIGKAVIKVNMQTVFFITLFTDRYMERLLSVVRAMSPEGLNLADKLHEVLIKQRAKFHARDHAQDGDPPLLARLGNYAMVALISLFALSCVEQFAQKHAMDTANARIEAQLKDGKRE